MKLASGKISNPTSFKDFVNDQVLYRAEEGTKYVSLIRLINTSSVAITFNLSVLFALDQLKLLKDEYTLAAGEVVRVTDKIYLDELEEIRCSVSADGVLHYIINGGEIADEANESSVNVTVNSEAADGGDSGIESERVIKLIPSSDERPDEMIYNSYAISQNLAKDDSAVNNQWLIDIKEPGSITAADGGYAGNSVFNDYVNIRGISRACKILLTDDTFESTPGTVLIDNVNIRYENSGVGDPKLKGQTFKDVYFNFDCDTIEFEDVKFEGICYIKITDGVPTFTNCAGGLVITNADYVSGLLGYFGVDEGDF